MPNKEAYVFDVDGTLTVSRTEIDLEFKEFFLNFIADNEVYILSLIHISEPTRPY